jgi:hypothetical protein
MELLNKNNDPDMFEDFPDLSQPDTCSMDNDVPDTRPPDPRPPAVIKHSLSDLIEDRRREEEVTTLADVGNVRRSQIRSEALSCSAEDLLRSGSMAGSASAKAAQLDATKLRRIEAYMSLDHKTVAQTRGWRIRAAYRMVCYMARVCGGLQGPMMLAHLFHNDYRPDPALYPFEPPDSTDVFGTAFIVSTL